MRIMIDTNIVISASLFPNSLLSQRTLMIADRFEIVLTTQVLEEFRKVVKRKFPHRVAEAERFLRRLHYELADTPQDIDPEIFPAIRDPKDYPILASAILADVDVIVTGDEDFLCLAIERPEVSTIAVFCEKYL